MLNFLLIEFYVVSSMKFSNFYNVHLHDFCVSSFLHFYNFQRPVSRHEELKERARILLEQTRREAQGKPSHTQILVSKVGP